MTTMTFLQLNDVHGYLHEHPEWFLQNGKETFRQVGGYARLKTMIDRIRAEEEHVVLFDNGDTFHGTYPVVKTKGESLIPILNELGFDAMTGHWDFAYGPEHLQQLVQQLNYPFLANNCFQKETDELLFPPSLLLPIGDTMIGIIGIASPIIDKTMPASFSEGVYFTNGDERLQEDIDDLKERGAELIVILSHLGFPQETKLAESFDDIDILLSGHTHNRLTEPATVNNTLLIQSGCHGSFLGKLTVTVERGKIIHYTHELLEAEASIPEHAETKALVDEAMAPFKQQLQQVIGTTELPLHRNAQLETTMDTVLLEAIAEAARATIAFSNGWRYGAPIEAGPITLEQLYEIIPTNPPVSTATLTGQDIWEMLEENIHATFASDPLEQKGGYLKRMLGITLYFKVENAYPFRIQQLFINDERIKRDKQYNVAFITVQGVPEKYGTNRQNLTIHAIDALREYIASRKKIRITPPKQIHLI